MELKRQQVDSLTDGKGFTLRMPRGGPEKIADWRSQTDGPLPVKNDSSLTTNSVN